MFNLFRKFYKKQNIGKETIKEFLDYVNSDHSGIFLNNISTTTWSIECEIRTNLEGLYNKHLRKKIENKVGKVCLVDIWYQKYNANSGSFHDWHIHPKSDYSIAFYLQMKDDLSLFTEYKISDKIEKPKVKVGDLIIFDSNIVHRSPPNNTTEDKIIISANLMKI
jgi:hypothetical protein